MDGKIKEQKQYGLGCPAMGGCPFLWVHFFQCLA